MNIVLVNTYDTRGGAARAAYRLHRGLRQIDENCTMLVRHKTSLEDTVVPVSTETVREFADLEFYLSTVVQQSYIDSHRTDISNTFFSLPYPGIDLSSQSVIRDADVINLHWTAFYQSPVTLRRLLETGKPVVWTLHDQWPFTGGCHYSAGCTKYRSGCEACPQLAEDVFGLAGAVLRDRRNAVEGKQITIVSPSHWMAERARESLVFRNARIEVIPNSVETDLFMPLPRAEARQILGLRSDGIVLLCGSENVGEKRKGFAELIKALRSAAGSLREKGNVLVLCYGSSIPELQDIDIPIVPLGYIRDEERLRAAYCAADIFLLPSLEDNLPNSMLESLSCGTPVVAFDTGGIPDVVVSGRTGVTVPGGDTVAFGQAILSLVLNDSERDRMGRNGRAAILERHSLRIQAQQYLKLYSDLSKASAGQNFVPRQNTFEDSDASSALGHNLQMIYEQILFRALKEFVLNREKDCLEHESVLKSQLVHEQENSRQLREWAERLDALLVQERQVGTQLREWAERSEALLTQERQLRESSEHTERTLALLQREIMPLRSFARRFHWLYKIYRRLAKESDT